MKTGSGRANAIGSYEVYFGDYHKLFDTANAYQRVTKEDIQRVARTYFVENNRTVATLVPDKTAQPPASQKSGGNQ
jgi:predicted Zn-dependent peptidase